MLVKIVHIERFIAYKIYISLSGHRCERVRESSVLCCAVQFAMQDVTLCSGYSYRALGLCARMPSYEQLVFMLQWDLYN